MRELRIIDATLCGGQRAHWGARMTGEMIMPMLPEMDRMGLASIDLMAGAVFDACVRRLGEDPWRRMRRGAARVTETPLNVWTRGQSLFGFACFPDDVVALTLERCAANGMRRLTTYDALNDIRNIEVSVATALAAGMHVAGHLVYTVSPVHTDAYYEKKAREIVALGVDALGIMDPGGLLSPERARALVPILRKVTGELPLELHCHCSAGLGEIAYLEAAPMGIDVLRTCVSPLASGDALPDARYVVGHLREAGFKIAVEDADLAGLERTILGLAEAHGIPVGKPRPYNPFAYHHQIPGGAIFDLRSELRDMGLGDRLDAVLEEAGRVREELGYPILAGPFARFVVTQAVINVVQGERYATIPDAVARYVLGYFGEIAGPVAPALEARVAEIMGGVEPVTERPGALVPPRVAKLRSAEGPVTSDDDIVLAAFYGRSERERLHAARDLPEGRGILPTPANGTLQASLELLANMPKRRGVYAVSHGGLALECVR